MCSSFTSTARQVALCPIGSRGQAARAQPLPPWQGNTLVLGAVKAKCHLMFGIIALAVDQIIRVLDLRTAPT
jgi:hypothetical protein